MREVFFCIFSATRDILSSRLRNIFSFSPVTALDIVCSSSPSSGKTILHAFSVSSGFISSNPETRINSAAAFGYTVLYILSECTGPGFVAMDVILFATSSHESASDSLFFAPCAAVYGLLNL